jgi:hypothetical protein
MFSKLNLTSDDKTRSHKCTYGTRRLKTYASAFHFVMKLKKQVLIVTNYSKLQEQINYGVNKHANPIN